MQLSEMRAAKNADSYNISLEEIYMKKTASSHLSITATENELFQHDIITFDIFDTLITRCVLRPVDVFLVVEAEAKKKGLITSRFSEDRHLAEWAAYEIYGDCANFEHIYSLLRDRYGYTPEQCDALKTLEIIAELDLAIPRKAVRDLVLRLLESGKRIVLCSDMYLSSDVIRKLLVKCGYPGDLELWVSNEKGSSKDSGTMWRQLFSYLPENKKIIHVGDNEQADHRILKQMGKDALLISSGLSMFEASEMYGYLSRYITKSLGNSMLLGYLVNKACFNSPFQEHSVEDEITAIWCGGIFSCFMDFLVQQEDESQLLFVTREGYLLKPMYERYCCALGKEPQSNTIFYASRAAALAASVRTAGDIQITMTSRYTGTLGHFLKSRLNYDLSEQADLYNLAVQFPEDYKKVMQLLEPYYAGIFENSCIQREAYLAYISQIRLPGKELKVADIGCNGTIQYGLSRILEEKVNGIYLFLNERTLVERFGCKCQGLHNPRSGTHPVYENQLFLEAAMQAPYGQLEKMVMKDGQATPQCRSDASFSSCIPASQEAFCGFTEWTAQWKKRVGEAMMLDFELAEAIWICLLKFQYLPKALTDSFWLADDFSGNPTWTYDAGKQIWKGTVMEAPLVFSLQKDGTKLCLKQRIKNFVKAHIPYFAFNWAQNIWHTYFK